MKSFFHCALSCAAAFWMLCIGAGCSDDDTPENTPVITIEGTPTVTETSVTVTFRAANADRAAWMLLEAAEPAPDVDKVLAEGQQLSGLEFYTVTQDNLKARTEYKVYAAAARGDYKSQLLEASVTTASGMVHVLEAGKNFITYHVEVAEGTTYLHVALLKRHFENFSTAGFTEPQVVNALLGMYGFPATGPKDFTLHDLDPHVSGAGRPYDVVAGMPYVVLVAEVDAEGQMGDYAIAETKTPDPEILSADVAIELVDVRADEVDIRITPDASITSIFQSLLPKGRVDELLADGGTVNLVTHIFNSGSHTTDFTGLSQWTLLHPKTDYLFYVIGIDANGDQTPLLSEAFTTPEAEVKGDTENLQFVQAPIAVYYGQVDATTGYAFNLILSTQTMTPNEHNELMPDGYPCHVFYVDFYATDDPGEARILPEGTYTLSESKEGGTIDFWTTWAAAFFGPAEEDYWEYEYDSGTVQVSHVDEGYRIDVNMAITGGGTYSGTYTGAIAFEPEKPSPFADRQARKAPRAERGAGALPVLR